MKQFRKKRTESALIIPKKKKTLKDLLRNIATSWQLYVLLLPALLYMLVFNYFPLYGIQIAFKDYKFAWGIEGSPWVGIKHFKTFFESYYFGRLMVNTFLLNILYLVVSFPFPIFLAVLMNQIRSKARKSFIQTIIYVPHFISTVVLAGMLYIFLSPSVGIFNSVRELLGLPRFDYMASAGAFRWIYILSGIWQNAGYSTILFIASLNSVDTSLYEAADLDGANIWQKIRYIDLPTLLPTAVMVFILDCGKLLSSNTSKTLVLQTAGNIPTSDIIGVYVYNVGLAKGQFSYTAAIGLFVNIVNFAMIMMVNRLSKKLSDVSLF